MADLANEIVQGLGAWEGLRDAQAMRDKNQKKQDIKSISSKVSLIDPAIISEVMGRTENLPGMKSQMQGLENLENLTGASARLPVQTDLSPLASFANAASRGQAHYDYKAPESPQERLQLLAKLQEARAKMGQGANSDTMEFLKENLLKNTVINDQSNTQGAENFTPTGLFTTIRPKIMANEQAAEAITNYMDAVRGTGKYGVPGAQKANLDSLRNIAKQRVKAAGRGQTDKEIEALVPDVSSLTGKSIAGALFKGGKKGAETQLDNILADLAGENERLRGQVGPMGSPAPAPKPSREASIPGLSPDEAAELEMLQKKFGGT